MLRLGASMLVNTLLRPWISDAQVNGGLTFLTGHT